MRDHLFRWSIVSLALLWVAVCAPSAEGESHAKKPDTVINVAAPSPVVSGMGAVATATAVCPAQTRIVGGGFLGGGIVFESRMVGANAWRVSSQNRTNRMSGVLTYAYCRKGAPKTIAVSQSSIAGGAGAGPIVIAHCPDGRKAVAGGFSTAPPVEPGLIDNVVTDSLRLGTGSWRTQALSGKAGPSVTGFAYCAKRKKARPARTGTAPTVTGDLTNQTAVSPSCGKQTALMGGFSQMGATGFGVAFPVYTQSQRAHKTWHVAATDVGGGPLTLSATAYCG